MPMPPSARRYIPDTIPRISAGPLRWWLWAESRSRARGGASRTEGNRQQHPIGYCRRLRDDGRDGLI